MADCSGTREPQMSEELTSAIGQQKKSLNLTASRSSSGKGECRTCCPTPTTIYLSAISGAGKSIAELNEKTRTGSTAESIDALRESANDGDVPFVAKALCLPDIVIDRKVSSYKE